MTKEKLSNNNFSPFIAHCSLLIVLLALTSCQAPPDDTSAGDPAGDPPIEKKHLASLIERAEQAKTGISASDDGADVDAAGFWVPTDVYNNLGSALVDAHTALENNDATQTEVDAAEELLQSCLTEFNNRKTPGLRPPADKTALSQLIETAAAAITGAYPSADGADVAKTDFWVPNDVYDNLDVALEAARTALAANGIPQSEVDAAKDLLQTRLTEFNNRKAPGTQMNHRLIPAGDGLAKNSVNTTPFRQNSLVTHGNTQYIAYFANNTTSTSQSALVLGKRALGETEFTTTTTSIMGWTNDAHNSACIMTDGDGYLHLALIHHNSALEVYRSEEPGSFNMKKITTDPVMAYTKTGSTFTAITGTYKYESSTTYTEFYRLPDDPAKGDGDLLFVYREGSSGNGNLVLNRYSREYKRWYRVQNIVVQGNPQNAYWQVYLDDNGRLHLSWVFRGSSDVRSNHDMYYACSDDQGVTWKKTDGTAYTLPITSNTADKVWEIPQDSNLMNQTSMTADKDSHPYIATYWGRPTMQYRVIYHDGTSWKMSQVSNRTTVDDGGTSLLDGSKNPSPYLSGSGTKLVPIARPRMVARYDTVTGKTRAYYIFRDNWERGGRVSMYSTADITSNTWTVSDLTDFDVKYYEPSHDTELWKRQGKLHVFVQYADYLSDGSSLNNSSVPAKPVYCLEVDLEQ